MTNIIDINKAKSKKPKAIKVKKEDSCLEVIKEWIPKYIANDIPSEYTISEFSRKWIDKFNITSLKSTLAYPALDTAKLNYDNYKNGMFENPNSLVQFSTHALSSLIKTLLDKYNLDNYILYSLIQELVSIDDFIYSTRSEYYTLPFREDNSEGVKETKGIYFIIKANDDSAIVCKLIIAVEKNK